MPVTIQAYEQFLELIGDGTIDLDGHTFKIALMKNTHSFDGADSLWDDVSANEIAAGNGYVTGGQVLTGVVWNSAGGIAKFDADNPSWTATGGAIETNYHAVIYDDTVAGDPLMFSIDFGEAKAAEEGADLNIVFDATAGIFQIANAA